MKLSDKLSHAFARPRSKSLVPRYPRHAIMFGAALTMAACAGGAPAPHQAAAPTASVQSDHAQPPSEDPPPPAETPEDEAVPLAGVAPQPFEP